MDKQTKKAESVLARYPVEFIASLKRGVRIIAEYNALVDRVRAATQKIEAMQALETGRPRSDLMQDACARIIEASTYLDRGDEVVIPKELRDALPDLLNLVEKTIEPRG